MRKQTSRDSGPVVERQLLNRCLQFPDLTLVEGIDPSEHHGLGRLYRHQGLHRPVLGVEGVPDLGLPGGLHVGDQVPHLARVEELAGMRSGG